MNPDLNIFLKKTQVDSRNFGQKHMKYTECAMETEKKNMMVDKGLNRWTSLVLGFGFII